MIKPFMDTPREDCPECGFPNIFWLNIDGDCTTEIQPYWICNKCGNYQIGHQITQGKNHLNLK